MNFKTKAFGLFAGSVLALSLTTGVMAQSVGTKVTLNFTPCSVSVTGAEVDFGTYMYDPNTGMYELNGSAGNSSFTVSAFDGSEADFANGCDSELTAAPLTNTEDAEGQIPVTLSQVEGATPGTTANILNVNVKPGTAGVETVEASIEDSLSSDYDALTYGGTITVTSDNAAE